MDQYIYEYNQMFDEEEDQYNQTVEFGMQQLAQGYSYFFGEGSSSNRRGSIPGRIDRRYKRDYKDGPERLMKDYFIENPTFDVTLFRRRFRMSSDIFSRIYLKLHENNPYFTYRLNGAMETGISPHIKISAALRMLSYGTAGDQLDEYFRISSSTAIECMKEFCKTVIAQFGEEYLRTPGPNDVARILARGQARGFPGMLGSLDCMHWA